MFTLIEKYESNLGLEILKKIKDEDDDNIKLKEFKIFDIAFINNDDSAEESEEDNKNEEDEADIEGENETINEDYNIGNIKKK